MTPSAHNICTRAIFATSSFNFGLPTYFVSHCCCGRSCFSKKVEQSCLTVVWQTTHIFVCIMLAPCFLFCSVQITLHSITLHIVQLLCYCEKDNLCSLLNSGRQIFSLVEINYAKSTRPAMSSERSVGSFSEQRLVIKPNNVTVYLNQISPYVLVLV